MKLNKFSYLDLYSKPLENHTLKIMKKKPWKFTKKPGKIMEISWNFVSGNPDVCLSTGEGVSALLHAGIHTDTPHGRPPLHSACWDTVNKRAVRIPLECILVENILPFTLCKEPVTFWP